MRLLALVTVVLLAAVIPAGPADAAIVYGLESFEGFTLGTAPGPEWSTNSGVGLEVDNTPGTATHPVDKFLGRNDGSTTLGLSNETVTLSLSGLPAHTDVSLSLALFIIQSWDGGSACPGGDCITIAADGAPLLNTTFALASGSQCYPSNCPASNAARTGADEPNNSLGYSFFGDNVYLLNPSQHANFTFPHTASTLAITFQGSGLQDIGDESWGIDDVLVEVTPAVQPPPPQVPAPATLMLLGSGLAGMAGITWRRRRKK